MKKNILIGFIIISILVTSVFVIAKPNTTKVDAINTKSKNQVIVSIPAHAVQVAPHVFDLGYAVDEDGTLVQGYAIVKYKKGFGKPTGCKDDGKCQGWEDPSCVDCQGGGEEPPKSSCYEFIARGAKWKNIEPYMVDPTNSRDLDEAIIRSNVALDITKWESAAEKDILGDEKQGFVNKNAFGTLNYENELFFGSIENSGAIAVTYVWGIWNGPPKNRKIVEWDQVYDEIDFDWSLSGEPDKMDFENIATHELGHSVGLADLYKNACLEETMYGEADEGETNKRTLENGDITGVYELYN